MNNRDNEVIEIDLFQVLQVIRKKILLLFTICILTSSFGFAFSKFHLKETFKATSRIIIVKDESAAVSSSVTYNDVQLSQKLVSTYKEIFKSEAISDEVINNLDLDIDSVEYNKMVDVVNENSTEVMSISVISNDPELSAKMANEIVNVFISKIYDIMKIQNVTILDRAKVPSKAYGPSVIKYTAIGGIGGLAIFALYIFIKVLTDTKVKNEDEVKSIFNYPIIGSIPDFLSKEIKYDE